MREGRWKLVAFRTRPWELYDFDADGTELTDLVTAMPERVTSVEQLWKDWKGEP